MAAVPSFKVVLVGDAEVGKSSVLGQWARNEFLSVYEPTVSPELTTKEVVAQGRSARIQVWDIGFGEPETVAQFPSFARGASGVLLMYDMSNPSSVDGVDHWREQVRSLTGPSAVFVVVGCKSDLQSSPGVVQKARNLCDSFGMRHVETSAYLCSNVGVVFETLAAELMRQTLGEASMKAPALEPPAPCPPSAAPAVSAVPSNPIGAGKAVKLALLGEPGVGKSCLAQHLGGGEEFESEYIPTAGPEMLTQQKNVNGVALRLQVWDVSGDDLMDNPRISGTVLQGIAAAVVLYDITDRGTFETVSRWFKLLEEKAAPDVAVILVGHKADQVAARAVGINEGAALAESVRIPFAEVSSRTRTGLDRLLDTLLAGGRVAPDWSGAMARETSAAVAPLNESTLAVMKREEPRQEAQPQQRPPPAAAAAAAPAAASVAAATRSRAGVPLEGIKFGRGGPPLGIAGERNRPKAGEAPLRDRPDRGQEIAAARELLKERQERRLSGASSPMSRPMDWQDRIRDTLSPVASTGSKALAWSPPADVSMTASPAPREADGKGQSTPGTKLGSQGFPRSWDEILTGDMGGSTRVPQDPSRMPPDSTRFQQRELGSANTGNAFSPFPSLSQFGQSSPTGSAQVGYATQAAGQTQPSAYGNVMDAETGNSHSRNSPDHGMPMRPSALDLGSETPSSGQGHPPPPVQRVRLNANNQVRSPSTQSLQRPAPSNPHSHQPSPMASPTNSPMASEKTPPMDMVPRAFRDSLTDTLGRTIPRTAGMSASFQAVPGTTGTSTTSGYPGQIQIPPAHMQQNPANGTGNQGLRRSGMGSSTQPSGMPRRVGGTRLGSPVPPSHNAQMQQANKMQASPNQSQQAVRPSMGGQGAMTQNAMSPAGRGVAPGPPASTNSYGWR